MRKLLHIALLVLLVAACGPRKIPRDDMERIMADMLIQDQQIKQDRKLQKQADTSLVYEGIFEQYGYDTDDFIYSVEYYLEDPSRMEKIMGTVAARMEKEAKQAGVEAEQEEWQKKFMKIYQMKVDVNRRPQPPVSAVDTLPVRMQQDSVIFVK